MTKVAYATIHMLDNNTLHLNDKKLSVMLFLMDYNHNKEFGTTIFGEEYIKSKRNPEAKTLGELFDVIANDEDLDEDDERLYLIQELIDYVDIEIYERKGFIELKFIKMEEEFDSSVFSKEELKTINKVINLYKDTTARNIANDCFKIDEVRETASGDVIL